MYASGATVVENFIYQAEGGGWVRLNRYANIWNRYESQGQAIEQTHGPLGDSSTVTDQAFSFGLSQTGGRIFGDVVSRVGGAALARIFANRGTAQASRAESGFTFVHRAELVAQERVTLNRATKNLINDIKQNGITTSIEYVEYGGKKYITNGHHRLFASYALDIQQVPAVRVFLPSQGYKTIDDLVEVPRMLFLKPMEWLKP